MCFSIKHTNLKQMKPWLLRIMSNYSVKTILFVHFALISILILALTLIVFTIFQS